MDEPLRRRYLEALGITPWQARVSLAAAAPAPQSAATEKPMDEAETKRMQAVTTSPMPSEPDLGADPGPSGLGPSPSPSPGGLGPSLIPDPDPIPTEVPPRGNETWIGGPFVDPFAEQATPLAAAGPVVPTLEPQPRAARIAGLDWPDLIAEVQQCTACSLCQTRTQTVFGVGHRQADWLVIGEAPGADEDQQGEPFVGRAGRLLTPMLQAVGLQREQVFIANILKCRPPENRDPTPTEASHCRPFLERQIALIQPRIILAVGRIAAQNLLNTETPIGKLRGQVHHWGPARIPLVVTYHPAYLLRSPREKRKTWDDLRLARRIGRDS